MEENRKGKRRVDENNILWILKRLNLSLEHYGRELLKDWDMSPSQNMALDYLFSQKDKEMYATDLHTRFGISKSTISSTLKGLKQKGYLKMVINPADDRKKQIVLTEKAYEMEKMIEDSLQKRQACICKGIPEQNLEILKDSLRTMIHNIKQEEHMRRDNT